MIIQRTRFFLTISLLIVIPLVLPRVWWLKHSRRTEGIMAFAGKGELGDQMPLDYSVIYFRHGKDTIWFNGLGNLRLPPGTPVPVRYNVGDPQDAQVDLFAGIWGSTLVNGGIPLLMLLVIFLHPDVVPRKARLRLSLRRPWIGIVNDCKKTGKSGRRGTPTAK